MRIQPETLPREMDDASELGQEHGGFSTQAASDIRLLYLARLFWVNRRFIFRFAAALGCVTLLLGLLTPNSYRSTTQLMPPENHGMASLASLAGMGSRMEGGGLGALAGDLLGVQSTGALFVAVLHSRTAEEDLIKRFHLTTVYGHPSLHWRTSDENARKQLEDNTEVTEDRKSGTISISVVDHDKQRAADIANGYVDELNLLIASLGTSSARREREFLEQRLVQVKRSLDDDSRRLSEFSSKNATFDPKDQGRATVEATATLQGQLMAAQSELQGLEAIYADNNIRVRSLQARIAELKKQLGNVSGTGDTVAPSNTLRQDMPLPSMRQLPLLGETYSDLFREAKIQETVYEVLTQQYEIAKVEEAKEIPTVRVLDKANIPDKKWGPHRLINAFLAAVAGSLIACVLVIAGAEWRRRDINDPYKSFLSEIYASAEKLWFARLVKRLINRDSRRLLRSES